MPCLYVDWGWVRLNASLRLGFYTWHSSSHGILEKKNYSCDFWCVDFLGCYILGMNLDNTYHTKLLFKWTPIHNMITRIEHSWYYNYTNFHPKWLQINLQLHASTTTTPYDTFFMYTFTPKPNDLPLKRF